MTNRVSLGQVPVGAVTATAAAFVICMAATTLPTPLYDLYAKRFGFHTLTITVLFAVYAAGVVVTLISFGQLSDAIGRRPVLLSAVAVSVLSSLILAWAPGLGMLLLGRVVSGLAAGLMTGAGTAAVIDLFPAGHRAAGNTLAVAANTGGLALGTFLAGLLADTASRPLVTPYLVQAILGVLAGVALWAATRRRGPAAGRRFRFSRPGVPAEIRGNFVRAVLSGGTAFAVTGVLTSVSALFLVTVLHDNSHLLAGSEVAIVFLFMAGGQLAARRVSPHYAMVAGPRGPGPGRDRAPARADLALAGSTADRGGNPRGIRWHVPQRRRGYHGGPRAREPARRAVIGVLRRALPVPRLPGRRRRRDRGAYHACHRGRDPLRAGRRAGARHRRVRAQGGRFR